MIWRRIAPVVVVLAVAFCGCGVFSGDDADLPTAEDALPVLELTHPSFREESRDVIDASTEDDLVIERHLVAAEPVTGAEVVEWYRLRLAQAGWDASGTSPDAARAQIVVDGHAHSLRVDVKSGVGAVDVAVVIEYRISVDELRPR